MRLFSILSGVVLITIAAGSHSDLLSQFGIGATPRTWDEAYTLASAFISKLSLLEKISLTTGTGIGLGPCSGNVASVQRLGLRHLCLQDGPAGLRGVDLVTLFPAGITTGSTWDKGLFYLRSRAMGVENRIKGVNVALAPVAGALGRAPAAGRNWEGFGADPYLLGVANAESVKGLQDEGVIACAKHWVANEQEHYRLVIESLRYGPIFQSISSETSERVLKELYEWPFFDAIQAGAGSVMCSYQRVNGEYTCESSRLIRSHLKSNISAGGLGFRGFVVTDWFATAAPHLASVAGVDMVMPGDLGLMGALGATKAASDGALKSGSRLDEMVLRTVAAWYKMRQDQPGTINNISFSSWNPDAEFGILLDRGYAGQINFHVPANSQLHTNIARRIAAEGTILLKNINSALPLGNDVKRIGVFGNDAGPIKNDCGDFGACTEGTLAVGWGSGSGTFDNLVDPLSAINSYAASIKANVTSVLDDHAYTKITQAASDNLDVCLAFINTRSGEGTNAVAGNEGDRNNLTAWNSGESLVSTVASSCKNTIVILHNVGAIILEPWIEHPNVTAVLLAHLPGQESGNALVDVLWGITNPSGKLPYTIAKRESDYCCRVQYAWTNFSPKQSFSEGLLVDYKWFDAHSIIPRFEFGFGLSYTNFSYSPTLTITPPVAVSSVGFTDNVFRVSTTITNSGARPGKEIAQLYISLPATAPADTPVRQLRGFEKILLQVGESGEVAFDITKRDLSYWSEATKEWVVPAGLYKLSVGASSRALKASGEVEIL